MTLDRSVFITYNPESSIEQTLAFRLHTIGAVNGFRMSLPDRINGVVHGPDAETRHRIDDAQWFICFTEQKLSRVVVDEITYAFQVKHDKSRIIVVFDSSSLRLPDVEAQPYTAVPFDPHTDSVDHVVKRIIDVIAKAESTDARFSKLKRERDQAVNGRNALAALLGVGLGLFALSTLSAEEERPKQSVKKATATKRPVKKSPTKQRSTKKERGRPARK